MSSPQAQLPTIPVANVPQPLRQVAHFVKIANEYATRDIVIYYWCIFKAVDDAMHIDSTSPEAKHFLMTLVDILEQVKKTNANNDSVMQNVVAQSYIEDQAQRLFQYAESQDSQGQFNQKMMKAFYTCGYLFDVLTMFGTLDENIQSARKYAKWRATYIFGCLKRGEQPVPGNQSDEAGKAKRDDGQLGDIAKEINDELSAELNALNASINGPSAGVPKSTYSTANEYSGDQRFQSQFHQPSNPPPYQQQPTNVYPGNYAAGGAYPSIGGAGGQPQFPSPAGFSFTGPKPGLQHQQEPPNRPAAPKPRSTPVSPPATTGSTYAHVEPAKPMATAQPAQNLKLEDYLEAKKYTKFASSALDYEDPKTAIDYLHKAIAVLQKQPPT